MIDLKELRKASLDHRKQWSRHSAEITAGSCEAAFLFKVGLAGTFTIEPIIPYLGAELISRGIGRPAVFAAPYNQLFQTCLNPDTAFGYNVDAIVLLMRLEDLFESEIEAFVQGEDEALEKVLDAIVSLTGAVRGLRENFKGPILASMPPYPETVFSDLRHLLAAPRAATFHRAVLDVWWSGISQLDQVYPVDLDGLQRYFGAACSSDSRKWYMYKQPYCEEFCYLVGQEIARTLAALKGHSKKCVIVDCDNTLWGGVVGEDGLKGIQIGNDFPGSAFRDFQRQLVGLQKSGVLIAIVSKNNEEDVWAVFDRHDAMLLKRSHLAAWRVNWMPKDQNIREIAAELNIGLDSLVFIDDSHFELETVRQHLPEVVCLQASEDPSELPGMFASALYFDNLSITSEDVSRTEMMFEERDRKRTQQTMSQGDFLASLGLSVEITDVRDSQVERVTQLINKTNQFNLTTIRRTMAEVEALRTSTAHRLFAMSVTDRFGDYGLVGVVILEKEGLKWSIDTFLLSCRVLGRGIETAMLSRLREEAAKLGAERLGARFIPTPKNKPAAGFLPDHGFVKTGETDWEASLTDILEVPGHIRIQ
jgi:FkbH-like protein